MALAVVAVTLSTRGCPFAHSLVSATDISPFPHSGKGRVQDEESRKHVGTGGGSKRLEFFCL